MTAWLSVLLIAVTASPALALVEDSSEDAERCVEVEAYAFRLGRVERKLREEEARYEALAEMAEQVWAEAFDERPELQGADALAILRPRYGVDEQVAGGRFLIAGRKKRKTVAYCLPAAAYGAVRDGLRAKRMAVVESMTRRFARLESLIEQGDLEAASTELADLRVDVATEALGSAMYPSAVQDRTRTFRVWLLEWAESVPRNPELIGELTGRAGELLEQGRLVEADRYVSQALEIDRTNEIARQMRIDIRLRRNAIGELLWEAEELAKKGRYAAAVRKLDEARAIGQDDDGSIGETAKTVDRLRAADLGFNPPIAVLVFAAYGSLGADGDRIEQRVAEESGLVADPSAPLSVGAGSDIRFGRLLLVGVTGSWGLSQASNFKVGEQPRGFYEVVQLTGGIGVATRRGTKRPFSFRLTGGVVWERVDVDGFFSRTLEDAGDQSAWFVRFAAQMQNFSVFVQHGFGFEDVTGSVVGWSDQLQLGVAGVF